jgi:hypothetical protein
MTSRTISGINPSDVPITIPGTASRSADRRRAGTSRGDEDVALPAGELGPDDVVAEQIGGVGRGQAIKLATGSVNKDAVQPPRLRADAPDRDRW